jgi:hypothetical protein
VCKTLSVEALPGGDARWKCAEHFRFKPSLAEMRGEGVQNTFGSSPPWWRYEVKVCRTLSAQTLPGGDARWKCAEHFRLKPTLVEM